MTNARSESVEGKVGKAVKLSFDAGCKTQFCMLNLRGTPEWDKAEGFSFWLKGDGSKHFGCIQFIWNEDYAARYDKARDAGDFDTAAVIAGECVDMISDIPPAAEVVDRMVKEASALLAGSNRYRVA